MSKDDLALQEKLDRAGQQVSVGDVYVHYKSPDNTYEVKGLAIQESDLTIVVIYKALYGAGLTFTRTLDVWLDQVEHRGKTVSRFRKVS